MTNVFKLLTQAYYDLLQGAISVEVYKTAVPMSETVSHVVVRAETGAREWNKSGFVTNVTMIVEVCGVFENSINPDTVEDIDQEVTSILLPSNGSQVISANGIQVTNVNPDTPYYLEDYDGSKNYLTKITRWHQRVTHN